MSTESDTVTSPPGGSVDVGLIVSRVAVGRSGAAHREGGRQDRYVTDTDEFDGFFAGNGNLTHIPNEFFDHTIPRETLAVVKIVGVIIRNTIGFQTKFGFRRLEAALSFSDIMRKAAISVNRN
jgi:hypothetical protein